MQVVLLPVGAEWYAVPVEWVREVVGAPSVAPLVTAPTTVLGLLNLRGQIVPLFDTAALLGVGTVPSATFAAVLQTPHGQAGLATTALPQRAVLGTATRPSELPCTIGLYHLDRRVIVLLDLAALLTPERLGAHGAGGALTGRDRDVALTIGRG